MTLHPPNLHEARSLRSTGGNVAPLYDIAPAPMGVAYYGLSNTTGTVRNTTANTTSLAGTFSTTDPLGEQTEEFDDPAFVQPTQDAYGAQLNAVLVNVSLFGQTSFYNPKDSRRPHGLPLDRRVRWTSREGLPERVLDAELHRVHRLHAPTTDRG